MYRISQLLVFLCFSFLCLRPALVVGKAEEQPDAQVKPDEGEEGVSVEDEKTAKPQAEGDEGSAGAEGEGGASKAEDEGEAKEAEEPESAPDVQTRVLFLEPEQLKPEIELQSGKRARLLVGFASLGPKARNYSVLAIDAAFRYPQDYTYFIQNHTARIYRTSVEAGNYATFEYSFNVHESFGGRPFGLTITIYYTLLEDETHPFHTAVFNATINIHEEERGFGADTLFLYVILTGLVGLVSFLVYHYLLQHGGKKRSRKFVSAGVERGTQDVQNVDTAWIPKHVLDTEQRKKAANGAPRRRKGGKYSETSGGEETAEDAMMTESDAPASAPAGRRGAKAGGGGGKGNKGGGSSGGDSD